MEDTIKNTRVLGCRPSILKMVVKTVITYICGTAHDDRFLLVLLKYGGYFQKHTCSGVQAFYPENGSENCHNIYLWNLGQSVGSGLKMLIVKIYRDVRVCSDLKI